MRDTYKRSWEEAIRLLCGTPRYPGGYSRLPSLHPGGYSRPHYSMWVTRPPPYTWVTRPPTYTWVTRAVRFNTFNSFAESEV